MQRRLRLVAAHTIALALLAGACGGGSGGGTEGAGETDASAVAVSGGEATVTQPVDAATLTPTTVINSPSQGSVVMSAIYDVLYTIDRDSGEIQPRIATDFSSPDGITWTLTLRSDVQFSDGTPLDAEAVRQQWERAKAEIRTAGWANLQDVRSITVIDPTTLTVVLAVPNRQFHQLIPWSSLGWIPSPTAVASGDDFETNPVGAGPFVLESRTPNAETVLTRNPNYWQDGLPKLDKLTVTTILDPQQAYDTLTTDLADAAVNVPDQFAQQAQDGGYTTVPTSQIGGSGWLFGTSRPPFDDIRAREAVYLAVDLEALNESVTGGTGTVATSLFPEGTPFHDPNVTFPGPDPDEAQRLFDELAADGQPVSFTVLTTGGEAQTRAVALQTQLAQYDNVEVEVEVADGSTYGATLFQGAFDLAAYGFGGADPEPALAGMRTTHARRTASMGSAEVDAAIEAGRTAPDFEGRKAAYDQLTEEISQLYRMIWLSVNHVWAVEGPDVTGLVTYGQGTPLFDNFGRTS
jgi:peptide/nickel transport system substrate-binding protein